VKILIYVVVVWNVGNILVVELLLFAVIFLCSKQLNCFSKMCFFTLNEMEFLSLLWTVSNIKIQKGLSLSEVNWLIWREFITIVLCNRITIHTVKRTIYYFQLFILARMAIIKLNRRKNHQNIKISFIIHFQTRENNTCCFT
jgi:hypothetical protein